MLTQMDGLCKCFVTPYTSVIPHVSRQMTLVRKFQTAQSTLKWRCFGVSSHVICKISILFEGFVTQSTLVWGFVGVHPHVSCQIVALFERFTAYRAAKILLAAVPSLVFD